MAQALEAGLTVVGNVAVDSVDGRPPSAGGCPSFAALAFAAVGCGGRVLTQRAPGDAELFRELPRAPGVSVSVLDAKQTSAFALAYDGEQRTMTVRTVGDSWTAARLQGAGLISLWVHAAPLLRGEFPLPTVAALRAAGHRISFDGQGLVRAPRTGLMRTDAAYDSALLEQLSVLKLADDEAAVVAGGRFTAECAARLGVAEILITYGSAGAEVYLDGGACERVAPRRQIAGVHTTGSGDMFAVGYAAARAAGSEPLAAAQVACDLVSEVLARRRSGEQV